MGRRLVDRPTTTLQTVTLTDEGKILLEHAKAIQARLDTAWADVHALSEGAVGTLRVGSYESVGAKILPHALELFKEIWPRIDVVLEEYDVYPSSGDRWRIAGSDLHGLPSEARSLRIR